MTLPETVNEHLQNEKTRIRAAVLATRDALAPSVRATASRLMIARICALTQYEKAKIVMTYMGFGSEIETQPFFERIIADGKIAVLPRVDRGSQTLMLHAARSTSDLLTGKWGIREPGADAPPVSINEIDFLLIPGVAFDCSGNRLGYGRGYYDKLLSTADPALTRVAAAFSCQIVEAVPVGPKDQRIDRIITENEIIKPDHDR